MGKQAAGTDLTKLLGEWYSVNCSYEYSKS
jgi:hypothetical protein